MNFKLQQVGGVLLAMALVLATSCKKEGNGTQPTPKPNNVVRVEASVDALSARAALEPQSGSLNYQVKFTTNDNIQLYVKQNGTVHTIGSVKPTFVGQQRQVCHFEFTLPSSVTRSQQMTIIGVNGGTAKAENNRVYLTTNRITAPLARFTPPIAFVLEGANLKDAEVPVKAKFEHLGVYEAIHIKNESNQSVAFNVALVNEQGQQPWQRGENDVWVVSDRKFENRSSTDKSVTDITIANGATDILYHWYLLADGEQSIPAMMKLKGKVGAESNLLSVNLQSKAVGQKFQKGYIYHAYATYKGDGKLYFTDKEGTPKNVLWRA